MEAGTISLVVAVIGILGAPFAFFVTTIYKEIIDQPNLDIIITQNQYNKSWSSIQVTNNGASEVTNMSLIINPHTIISFITNNFSTVDIYLPTFNNSILELEESKPIDKKIAELYVKKLTQGGGSKIRIDTIINNNNFNFKNYEVYAVYDQGSKISKGIDSQDPFSSFNRILSDITFQYILIIYILYFFILIPITNWFLRKFRLKNFAFKLEREMLSSLRELDDLTPNDIGKTLQESWTEIAKAKNKSSYLLSLGNYLRFGLPPQFLISRFKSQDFRDLDNFYHSIKKRNDKLVLYEKSNKEFNEINTDLTDKLKLKIKEFETLITELENIKKEIDQNQPLLDNLSHEIDNTNTPYNILINKINDEIRILIQEKTKLENKIKNINIDVSKSHTSILDNKDKIEKWGSNFFKKFKTIASNRKPDQSDSNDTSRLYNHYNYQLQTIIDKIYSIINEDKSITELKVKSTNKGSELTDIKNEIIALNEECKDIANKVIQNNLFDKYT